MLILGFFFFFLINKIQGCGATPSRLSHTVSQDDHVSKANASAIPSLEVWVYVLTIFLVCLP
jgi:hypothetical protein